MILKILAVIVVIQVVASTPSHSQIEYIGKTPYHVSIRNEDGVHICSGAIIKSKLILTSGNCEPIEKGYVVAGAMSVYGIGQTVKIIKIDRKIGAFGEHFMNLYHLEKDLNFAYGAQPIPISLVKPSAGSNGRVSGFVELNEKKSLHSAEVQISDYEECKVFINHPRYYEYITCTVSESKEQICRALEKTSLLICYGQQLELCGVGSELLNFSCDSAVIRGDSMKLFTKFIRFSQFEDWLKEHGAL